MSTLDIETQLFLSEPQADNLKIARWMIWTGPPMFIAIGVGMLMARILPPLSPSASAQEIARTYVHYKTQMRLGFILMFTAITFWAIWCVAIAYFIRRMERGFPILTCASLVLAAAGTVVFLLTPFIWLVAAFRPETVPPDVTRMLNDAGWILYVFPGPLYFLWSLVTAVAVFLDPSEPRVFPRWVAYLNIWFMVEVTVVLTVPFIKSGPFSWDGFISWWTPAICAFVYAVGMTVAMVRALKQMETEVPAGRGERMTSGRP